MSPRPPSSCHASSSRRLPRLGVHPVVGSPEKETGRRDGCEGQTQIETGNSCRPCRRSHSPRRGTPDTPHNKKNPKETPLLPRYLSVDQRGTLVGQGPDQDHLMGPQISPLSSVWSINLSLQKYLSVTITFASYFNNNWSINFPVFLLSFHEVSIVHVLGVGTPTPLFPSSTFMVLDLWISSPGYDDFESRDSHPWRVDHDFRDSSLLPGHPDLRTLHHRPTVSTFSTSTVSSIREIPRGRSRSVLSRILSSKPRLSYLINDLLLNFWPCSGKNDNSDGIPSRRVEITFILSGPLE